MKNEKKIIKIKDLRFKIFEVINDNNNYRNYSFYIEENIEKKDIISFLDYMIEYTKSYSKVKINIFKDNLLFCIGNIREDNKEIIFLNEDID